MPTSEIVKAVAAVSDRREVGDAGESVLRERRYSRLPEPAVPFLLALSLLL